VTWRVPFSPPKSLSYIWRRRVGRTGGKKKKKKKGSRQRRRHEAGAQTGRSPQRKKKRRKKASVSFLSRHQALQSPVRKRKKKEKKRTRGETRTPLNLRRGGGKRRGRKSTVFGPGPKRVFANNTEGGRVPNPDQWTYPLKKEWYRPQAPMQGRGLRKRARLAAMEIALGGGGKGERKKIGRGRHVFFFFSN